MLHVLGDPGVLADADGVAVVGARRASSYGLEVARAIGRGLSAARRDGRLRPRARASTRPPTPARWKRPGRTIGVLAASAHIAYPARGWRLHAAVAARGAVISEMPPGAQRHRWCFVARNRIIAALAAATVVVQATERSGSLTTADFATELGRAVGAVPGRSRRRLSGGTHALIQAGAPLIRDAADALDLLAERHRPGVRRAATAPAVALAAAAASPCSPRSRTARLADRTRRTPEKAAGAGGPRRS